MSDLESFVTRRHAAVAALVEQDLLDADQPVVGILDTEAVANQVESLSWSFRAIPETLHTVACKAVTLVPVLKYLAKLGLGCEVASPGEFAMAEAAGFHPSKIVVDSPAKTLAEIEHALTVGAALNIDSYQEMGRLDRLRETLEAEGRLHPDAVIGVRVNPVIGSGTIGEMSTATTTTKFGIPLIDEASREELVAAVVARPWISQLHVHSGSQGISLDQACAGISRIVELAESVNEAGAAERGEPRQITRIDIGGGLSVNFSSDEITPGFHDYAQALERHVPGLFSGDYLVITEFGRSLLAKAGSIASLIEYTKDVGTRRFAITHAGAQTATRTAFMPASWPLRVSAYLEDGSENRRPTMLQDLAGPCCFTGDMIGRDYVLPEFAPGDIALIHDTGAYYYSTPFAYNALPRIPVYAYADHSTGEATPAEAAEQDALTGTSASIRFTCVRRQQTVEELLAEAGAGEPVDL